MYQSNNKGSAFVQRSFMLSNKNKNGGLGERKAMRIKSNLKKSIFDAIKLCH